jgi:alpha-glucosidase
VIKVVIDNPAMAVALNGTTLPERESIVDFNASESGWINGGNKTIIAKSGGLPVADVKEFVVTLGDVPTCTSSFSSVSVPGAGNGWNPADPDRSLSCAGGVLWKGRLTMANEPYKFAANGSWKVNWGSDGKQGGPNFPPVPAGVYDVSFNENDPANPVFSPVDVPGGISARFICDGGHTTFGTSVYALGNVPELGRWKAEKAVKLNPDGPYPRWTGMLNNLPGNTHIEWKCVKRLESGGPVIEWQPGNNNVFTSPASGSAGE